jgi:hypothetical protein
MKVTPVACGVWERCHLVEAADQDTMRPRVGKMMMSAMAGTNALRDP